MQGWFFFFFFVTQWQRESDSPPPSPALNIGYPIVFYEKLSDLLRKMQQNLEISIPLSPRFPSAGPPSSPEVTGLPQNRTLREGQTVELVCSGVDGSPSPDLRWFVGDGEEVAAENVSSSSSGGRSHPASKITVKVTREDNNREYRYSNICT